MLAIFLLWMSILFCEDGQQDGGQVPVSEAPPAQEKTMDPPAAGRVMIGPYWNRKLAFDGSDLIINAPKVKEYLTLLHMKQDQDKAMPSPWLLISGLVEGQAFYYTYTHGGGSYIDLSDMKLDFFASVAPCISGMIGIEYDDGDIDYSWNPIDNSRVYLDKGYLMIGNFDCMPYYGVLGQIYLPFGRFSSLMISNSLNKSFQTKERAFVIGYETKSPKVSIEAYLARATFSPHPRDINLGGVDVQVQWEARNHAQLLAAFSFINNISDGKTFNALFSALDESPVLKHNIPGLNFYTNYTISKVNLSCEYTTALRGYSPSVLSYHQDPLATTEGKGAYPKAFTFEATYAFTQCRVAQSLSVGFQKAWQMIALYVPDRRFLATWNLTIWRDSLLAFEWKYDHYSKLGGSIAGETMPSDLLGLLGKSVKTLTTQLDFYF